jgi:hypothetical protein
MEVIEDFQIQPKIGYFMLDNATSNDKCANLLTDRLFLPEQAYFNKFSRLRCIRHILNLVVKGLLFGKIQRPLKMKRRQCMSYSRKRGN